MVRTVLLVSADRQQLTAREKAVGPLADKVYVATSFPQAKSILMEAKPDVLVTDLRLHEFNGIHLALWSRVRLPHLRSVIVGHTDPSLAGDARAFGFDYLQEEDSEALVDHTLQALDKELPQRRWPRKRLPFGVQAEIGGQPVELVEVGYGGFRAQIEESDAPEPDTTFVLEIAEFGVRATARCVWTSSLAGSGRWCGAVVVDEEGPAPAWRTFVDAMLADPASVSAIGPA
jgi:hypothetical protein